MAEPTWLTFDAGQDSREFRAPVVHWREHWEGEWTVAPLWCEGATFGAVDGGKTTQALFRKRYGYGIEAGATEPALAAVTRLDDKARWFVRVTFSHGDPFALDPLQRKWYGVLMDEEQDRAGTRFTTDESTTSGLAQGVQTIRARGLEYLLEQTIVTSAWIAKDLAATEAVETHRGLTFNRDGVPNASDVDDDPDGIARFFHEGVDAEHWSTHQAVRYLLRRNGPRNSDNEIKVPFRLYQPVGGVPILPDQDRPILETDSRRTKELLDALISRQRGYGYSIEPNSDESWVELKPFTFVDEDVVLDPEDESNKLPANPSLWNLDIEADRSAGQGVKFEKRTTEKFDRVIVKGARRRSCFTVSFADENLQNDWSTEDEDAYEAGASGAGDYPVEAEVEERQRRDEEARNALSLRDVYQKLRFPEEWDKKAGDGVGGEEQNAVLLPEGAIDEPQIFLPEVRVQRTIPLLRGVDYAESAIQDHIDENPGETINDTQPLLPELAPFGLLKLVVGQTEPEEPEEPEDIVRWLFLDTLENFSLFPTAVSEDVDLRWSAEVEPTPDVPGFRLAVRGAPQHIIAKDRFSPTNPAAVDAKFDYRTFLFTIAVEEDRRCEGSYDEFPVSADCVRPLVLLAGDDYRLDYVVPQTVVGVDGTTGALIRSEGGYVRDDRQTLKETARLAYEWYRADRASLAASTGDFEAILTLPIGAYIKSIGRESVSEGNHNQDVESVVTEIAISCPMGQGGTPPAPRFAFRTDYVENAMRRGGMF